MLSVSQEIKSALRHIYGDVAQACVDLGIDYVVVGAAARDLVLHNAYGAEITRATKDVDFGLNVESWESLLKLRDALIAKGYTESETKHRLFAPSGIPVDIIPFGQIADADSNIAWPPDGETIMSVLGFKEAHEHSDLIRIQDDPPIDVRVAAPVGMALLKIVAWRDRSLDIRRKDAKDLYYLLDNYSAIPEVEDAIYSDPELGSRHEWDVELMSAELLGQRARDIAAPETAQAILALADHAEKIESLGWEMSGGHERLLDRSNALLAAFFEGFRAGA